MPKASSAYSRAIKCRMFSLGSKGGGSFSSHLQAFHNISWTSFSNEKIIHFQIGVTKRVKSNNCYPFGFWLWPFSSSFYGGEKENDNHNQVQHFHRDSLCNLERCRCAIKLIWYLAYRSYGICQIAHMANTIWLIHQIRTPTEKSVSSPVAKKAPQQLLWSPKEATV